MPYFFEKKQIMKKWVIYEKKYFRISIYSFRFTENGRLFFASTSGGYKQLNS